ncbi:MAG: sulfatase-like hydrolase/transferase [Halovenus sp.]
MPNRPNILFVFPEYFRGDCLASDPNSIRTDDEQPTAETPTLDHIAATGTQFTSAYTPSPTCVPARRCLWTGRTAATNASTSGRGENTWGKPWEFEHSLPGELSDAGYQTRLIGKTHSQPTGREFGFDHMELHAGVTDWDKPERTDDYTEWLDGNVDLASEISHMGRGSVEGRPWHLEERLHPTHWTTSRAVQFLESRDETRPFFLTLGYVRPHPPFDPPRPYWEMYNDRELPDPVVGDWVDDVYGDVKPAYFENETGTETPNPMCAELRPERIHRARAGYFGLITQLDHQLRRVLDTLRLQGDLSNTVILFASDHGTMLGDHDLWYISYGFEATARIPLVLRLPDWMDFPSGLHVDRPVGLEDVMPTLLELAGVEGPDTVEGQSLLKLVDDPETEEWREVYHGEQAQVWHPKNATQFLSDGTTKYIWNPITGDELLFDIGSDPHETENLATYPEEQARLKRWRQRLIDRLHGREEGFTDGTRLLPEESGS